MMHGNCKLCIDCLSEMQLCTLACVAAHNRQIQLPTHGRYALSVLSLYLIVLSEHALCVMMLQESKKGSKYTLNLAPGASERTTPRKAAPRTPKRSQSAVPALDFHDSENKEPFSASQELVSQH